MTARVDYYFDVVCPYAYLGHTQIEAICARHGAELRWKPILLGGLFRAVRGDDGPMPAMSDARRQMGARDVARWAERWAAPLAFPPGHPRRTVAAMRAIIAAGDIPRAAKALFRAYWVEGRDLEDEAQLAAALDAAGFAGKDLVAKTGSDAVKDELRARTDEAALAGAFGVPAMVIHREGRPAELLWGQDRLDFVERALAEESSAAPELQIWFDYSSPFSYLGATQVERIAAQHGARLVWRPFLLGALFKAIGAPNVPLAEMSEPKRRWMAADLDRWARRWGVPFRFASRFPMNTVAALRMSVQLENHRVGQIALAMFRALWVEDRDLSSPDELRAIADAAGFDGGALLSGCERPEVKQRLRDATDAAAKLGACGAPCFLVRPRPGAPSELFWGQDRLPLVEIELARAAQG